MRPFLAFDTATDHLALGIGDLDEPNAVLAARDFASPRAANTQVLPVAERLLESIGLEPRSLHAVAVGRGPGSFTGVRIGVATAKGLAFGLRAPLIGFGTLAAIAFRAPAGLIGVVGDAMRGEVYPALFEGSERGLRRLDQDRVTTPEAAAAEWAALDRAIVLTGAGLIKHLAAFERALGERASVLPTALWVPDGHSLVAAAWMAEGTATLGAIAPLARGDAFGAAHPQTLLPIYTRLADAEEAERVRLGRPDSLPHGGVAGPGEGE